MGAKTFVENVTDSASDENSRFPNADAEGSLELIDYDA